MTDPKKPAAKRVPPNAGKGRKKGQVNKTTAALKEAILQAAEAVGVDGKGKEGLVGYLKRVATQDVKAFASLLGKVLPLQITGEGGGPIAVAPATLTDEQLASIAAGAALALQSPDAAKS